AKSAGSRKFTVSKLNMMILTIYSPLTGLITIISSLRVGKSLVSNFFTLSYPPLSSSYTHTTLPSDHQSFQSLVCPSVSFSPFFPPAQVLTTHHLSRHVLSNSPAFSNSF